MRKADNIYPDLELVFLKALNYPDFARSEYYIREQKQSCWSKDVFLHSLMEMYHHFAMILQITSSVEKRRLKKEDHELSEEFGIDLLKDTDGKVEGTLTKKDLEDLRSSILNAYRMGKSKPVFDSYQVIAVCERMFIYIRDQFKEQIQKTSHAKYLADKRRKEGQIINVDPEYVIKHYNIISEAPVIDFNRFRNEVRNLLLYAVNPDELKTILKPLYTAGVEIVDLWNNKLQPIEVAPNAEALKKVIYDQALITFDPLEWVIWTHNIYSPDDLYREPSKHFLNQDFAAFAAKVANFISIEILKNSTAKNLPKTQQRELEDFDDLFINPEHKAACYDLLKEVELIGSKGNYTGNLKSAFCVWANELISQKIIQYAPDQILTKLLNRKFPGLEMSNSNFRTALTKARKDFQRRFSKAMKLL